MPYTERQKLKEMRLSIQGEIQEAWESINFLAMAVENLEDRKSWVDNELIKYGIIKESVESDSSGAGEDDKSSRTSP